MIQWCAKKGRIEAGLDEAGRGCLAGPVVAAAVILNDNSVIDGLNDSKKLNEKQRNELRIEIESKALSWAVGIVDHLDIDRLNILNASIEAMHRALNSLSIIPEFLLVDGNRFKAFKDIPYSCEVKGDGRFASIAAASVLAKTHRDEIMIQLDRDFPEYHWKKNKGYPTPDHINAYRRVGPSPLHRKSFHIKSIQLELEL